MYVRASSLLRVRRASRDGDVCKARISYVGGAHHKRNMAYDIKDEMDGERRGITWLDRSVGLDAAPKTRHTAGPPLLMNHRLHESENGASPTNAPLPNLTSRKIVRPARTTGGGPTDPCRDERRKEAGRRRRVSKDRERCQDRLPPSAGAPRYGASRAIGMNAKQVTPVFSGDIRRPLPFHHRRFVLPLPTSTPAPVPSLCRSPHAQKDEVCHLLFRCCPRRQRRWPHRQYPVRPVSPSVYSATVLIFFLLVVYRGSVVECEPTAITWTGGTGTPFSFTLRELV